MWLSFRPLPSSWLNARAKSFAIASSVKYREIRQNFSNSVFTTDELIQGNKFALLLAEIFFAVKQRFPFLFPDFFAEFSTRSERTEPVFFELLRRVLGNMEFATPTLFYFSKFIKVDLHIFAYKTSFQTHSLSDFLQKPLLKVVRSRLRTRDFGSLAHVVLFCTMHTGFELRTSLFLVRLYFFF